MTTESLICLILSRRAFATTWGLKRSIKRCETALVIAIAIGAGVLSFAALWIPGLIESPRRISLLLDHGLAGEAALVASVLSGVFVVRSIVARVNLSNLLGQVSGSLRCFDAARAGTPGQLQLEPEAGGMRIVFGMRPSGRGRDVPPGRLLGAILSAADLNELRRRVPEITDEKDRAFLTATFAGLVPPSGEPPPA